MDDLLKAWGQSIQKEVGDSLVGILVYGSVLRGEYVAKRSDLNLMVVVKLIKLPLLTQLRNITRKHLAKHMPQLICWTREELKNAWDVFPLEFTEIAKNHRVLFGEDPFKKNKVSKKNLRYQLEFELRSKLLALRSAWMQLSDQPRELETFLIKAGTSFSYLFNQAQQEFKIKALAAVECLEQIKQLKKKTLRLKPAEIQSLFQQLHTAAEIAVRAMDAA